MSFHTPVLLYEAVDSLRCNPGGVYVDGTVGGGGHAYEILSRITPTGRLIGIDLDDEAIRASERRLAFFNESKILIRGNYSAMDEILKSLGIEQVDGILLDLGVSSHQLETTRRGFSFLVDGPLDMRLNSSQGITVYDYIHQESEENLKACFRKYGEEPMAGKIAKAICQRRRITSIASTRTLASLVAGVLPPRRKRGKIHPATKVFQALRIAVNDELGHLEQAIRKAVPLLSTGGRLSIITFHSLEDRMVKTAFNREEAPCQCPPRWPVCRCTRDRRLQVVTKKPIQPSLEEIQVNPRSRSAKLRTAERV